MFLGIVFREVDVSGDSALGLIGRSLEELNHHA